MLLVITLKKVRRIKRSYNIQDSLKAAFSYALIHKGLPKQVVPN